MGGGGEGQLAVSLNGSECLDEKIINVMYV